jgi:hypothetical protein
LYSRGFVPIEYRSRTPALIAVDRWPVLKYCRGHP